MGNRLAASKFRETFTVTPTKGPWGSTCPTCEGVCKGIPLNVVDASCMQLCLPLLFEELSTFGIVQNNRKYSEDIIIQLQRKHRYMVAIQLPMMYLKVNCRDIKKLVEQPNSTEPIQ